MLIDSEVIWNRSILCAFKNFFFHYLVFLWFPMTCVFLLRDAPSSICTNDACSVFEVPFFLVGSYDMTLYWFCPYSHAFFAKVALLATLYMFLLNVCVCSSEFRDHLFFVNRKFLSPTLNVQTQLPNWVCTSKVGNRNFCKHLKLSYVQS